MFVFKRYLWAEIQFEKHHLRQLIRYGRLVPLEVGKMKGKSVVHATRKTSLRDVVLVRMGFLNVKGQRWVFLSNGARGTALSKITFCNHM